MFEKLKTLFKESKKIATHPIPPPKLEGNEPRTSTTIKFSNKQVDYVEESITLYGKAKELFDKGGDFKEVCNILDRANRFHYSSFVPEFDDDHFKRFYSLNVLAYKEAKKLKIPLKGIANEDLSKIQHELMWYSLNNNKADYIIMAFLLFRNYHWKEFEDELKATKEIGDKNLTMHYFVKNESGEQIDLIHYEKKFYSLSHDARILLTSFNAIGRERKVKNPEEILKIKNSPGYNEIQQHGYIQEVSEELIIEFPVTNSKKVMYEKKKLQFLLIHLQTIVHAQREWSDIQKDLIKATETRKDELVVLINGFGGSSKCRKEFFYMKDLKKSNLIPHAVGCKCSMSQANLRHLSDAELNTYGIIK
ncbi:hypothetical protein ACQKL5_16245 [Peribacillus sp. NPDC097675]|uniref:hypothetical protein n=1 Tax=Peribacillus sp. NPDC097675 TaxID=3390618 RepID=UPI003CFF0228